MFISLSNASIKVVQGAIFKGIMGPKKSNKGRQAWDKACIDFGLRSKKLNTHVKMK
jgi:hypothetical protein